MKNKIKNISNKVNTDIIFVSLMIVISLGGIIYLLNINIFELFFSVTVSVLITFPSLFLLVKWHNNKYKENSTK